MSLTDYHNSSQALLSIMLVFTIHVQIPNLLVWTWTVTRVNTIIKETNACVIHGCTGEDFNFHFQMFG